MREAFPQKIYKYLSQFLASMEKKKFLIFILLCFIPIVAAQLPEENRNEEGKVLIKAIYPLAHPNLDNEFVTLYNPSAKTIDLAG